MASAVFCFVFFLPNAEQAAPCSMWAVLGALWCEIWLDLIFFFFKRKRTGFCIEIKCKRQRETLRWGKLSYYLKVGQHVTSTCQKPAAAEGLSDGSGDEACYKQPNSSGGAACGVCLLFQVSGLGVCFLINILLIAPFPLPEVQRSCFTCGIHPPDREDGAHRLPREQPARAGSFRGRICQLAGFSQD